MALALTCFPDTLLKILCVLLPSPALLLPVGQHFPTMDRPSLTEQLLALAELDSATVLDNLCSSYLRLLLILLKSIDYYILIFPDDSSKQRDFLFIRAFILTPIIEDLVATRWTSVAQAARATTMIHQFLVFLNFKFKKLILRNLKFYSIILKDKVLSSDDYHLIDCLLVETAKISYLLSADTELHHDIIKAQLESLAQEITLYEARFLNIKPIKGYLIDKFYFQANPYSSWEAFLHTKKPTLDPQDSAELYAYISDSSNFSNAEFELFYRIKSPDDFEYSTSSLVEPETVYQFHNGQFSGQIFDSQSLVRGVTEFVQSVAKFIRISNIASLQRYSELFLEFESGTIDSYIQLNYVLSDFNQELARLMAEDKQVALYLFWLDEEETGAVPEIFAQLVPALANYKVDIAEYIVKLVTFLNNLNMIVFAIFIKNNASLNIIGYLDRFSNPSQLVSQIKPSIDHSDSDLNTINRIASDMFSDYNFKCFDDLK